METFKIGDRVRVKREKLDYFSSAVKLTDVATITSIEKNSVDIEEIYVHFKEGNFYQCGHAWYFILVQEPEIHPDHILQFTQGQEEELEEVSFREARDLVLELNEKISLIEMLQEMFKKGVKWQRELKQ